MNNGEEMNNEEVNVAGDDNTDARSLFDRFTHKSTTATVGQLTVAADSLSYDMKHANRGKCLIINNKTFDPNTRLNERRGTEVDAKCLEVVMKKFGFDVAILNDGTSKEITSKLKSLSKENHRDNDCLCICILTHGEQGVLWARDEKYLLESVFNYFKGDQCPSLAGKPKLFFIQACQGDKLDPGVTVNASVDKHDAGVASYRIPSFADFLISYSTVPGFYSWRNTTQGSWYCQALVQVLTQYHGQTLDLVTLLTIVNQRVAYSFESNVPTDSEFDRKKQIPCITSMLTRLVFFTPKI